MVTKYYIGFCSDKNIRYKASSGGIGSTIIQYLLSTPDYGTSLSFYFDKEKCAYDVKLIHSFDEYNNCGSIYQDINILSFIKSNLVNIKSGIVLCCPPCQITGIRAVLTKANIKHFIVSFCCSGQTTIEGTWCYYKFLGISKESVKSMQYRGNGWPSGIQIELNDGTKVYHENYTEPWVSIHRSLLFRPKRCLYCTKDTGRDADVAIADPWLDEYRISDTVGNTMFLVNTDVGNELLLNLKNNKLIEYIESSYNNYAIAQKTNIQKQIMLKEQRKYIDNLVKLKGNKRYVQWATKSEKNLKFHLRILKQIYRYSSIKNFETYLKNIYEKFFRRIY